MMSRSVMDLIDVYLELCAGGILIVKRPLN